MNEIARGIKSQGLEAAYGGAIVLKTPEEAEVLFREIATNTVKDQADTLFLFSLDGSIDEFIAAHSPTTGGEWNEERYQVVELVLRAPNIHVEPTDFAKAVRRRLSEDAELPKREVDRLVRIFVAAAVKDASVWQEVRDFAASAFVFRRIFTASKIANNYSVNKLIVWALWNYDLSDVPSAPAGAAEGFQYLLDMCKDPEFAHSLMSEINYQLDSYPDGLIRALLIEFPRFEKLVSDVLKNVISERDLGSYISPETYIECFTELESLCSVSGLPALQELTSQLLNSRLFVTHLNDFAIPRIHPSLPQSYTC